MKDKNPAPVTPQLVRDVGQKATQARRSAETDEKLARAAKLQLKSARKTWKLARKAAKRSAKRARRAEKEFRSLEKQLRRSKPKVKSATKPKSSARKASSKSVRKPKILPPVSEAVNIITAPPLSAAPGL